MKILYRYIFWRLWGPFLFGLLGTTLIIALDPMQKAMDFLFKNKIDGAVVFEWFLCSLPKDMLFIFPTASLLAGLLVYNTFSRNSELVAMFAGGVSFFSTLRPTLLFSLIVFLIVLAVQDLVIPPALKRRGEIFTEHIKRAQKPTYRRNVVLRISKDRLLCIGKIELNTKTLKDLVIYEPEGRMISALSASLNESGGWVLRNLWVSTWKEALVDGVSRVNDSREMMEYELDLTSRDMERYEKKKPAEVGYVELLDLIRYHESRGVISTVPLWVDFYSKTAFPFAIFIFTLLGAALGQASPRGGGFLGFGISLTLSFFYFIIMGFCAPMGKNEILSPFLAGWTQNLVFLGLTLWVIFRAHNR